MTKDTYSRAIKLKKSYSYTTYQFFGSMNNKNTSLTDGLKIAALTCLRWIRDRLEEHDIPEVLILPHEDQYKKVKEELFKSTHINNGYTLDVVSDFKEGLWAIRIIESDRGTTGQEPIVGRIIQSDLAFKIIDHELKCAFKTTISDIEGTPKARAYRFSPVTRLYKNKDFGLKQIINIDTRLDIKLDNIQKIKDLKKLYDNVKNQLPMVIFIEDIKELINFDSSIDHNLDSYLMKPSSFNQIGENLDNDIIFNLESKNPIESFEHDVAYKFAMWNMGYCRTYIISKDFLKEFCKEFKCYFVNEGKLICLEPIKYGGKITNYQSAEDERFKNKQTEWCLDRTVDFEDVLFVEEALAYLDSKNQEEYLKIQHELDSAQNKIDTLQKQNERLDRKDSYVNSNKSMIKELNDNIDQLRRSAKDQNNKINSLAKENNYLKNENKSLNLYFSYIERKLDRPKYHSDIVKWSNKYFGKLEFHNKAIDLLSLNSAERVPIDTICDALDFLGTSYQDHLFNGLGLEEMNNCCSKIYDRPYDVSPSGIPDNLALVDASCKIKYELNNIKKEYVLDQHLKIGGSGDKDLLRIYFLIDKDKQKIVIGALPNHLDY